MFRIMLLLFTSLSVLAGEYEESPTYFIPQIMHAVWVGPEPLCPEFKNNILITTQNFQDFEVHLWTSKENINEEEWPNYPNLHLHSKSDLQCLLECEPQTNIWKEIHELLDYRLYAGAKDILQHVLLYCYGGIVFDVDLELQETVRELVGDSQFPYYCFASTPQLLSSVPKGIFPKTALDFFKEFSLALSSLEVQNRLLENIKQNDAFQYTHMTTGALVAYTNRILQFRTTDANLHNASLYLLCEQCEELVFDNIYDLLQTNKPLSAYCVQLDTPSSLTETEMTPDIIRFVVLVKELNFEIFRSFLVDSPCKFYDCCSVE
jgi:hypothetical protein